MINKNIGIWDVENTTQLDDVAYTIYCEKINILMDEEYAGILSQDTFIENKKYVKIFYTLALKKLRRNKLKNICSKKI